MITRLKKVATTIIGSAMLFSLFSFAAMPVAYAGSSKCAALEGIGLTSGGGDCDEVKGQNAENKINNVVNTIVDLLSFIVGIAAVIMVIVAGFKFVTAGGDTNNVASAKSTLIYAVVGLVVVALAQFIVNFVINQAD